MIPLSLRLYWERKRFAPESSDQLLPARVPLGGCNKPPKEFCQGATLVAIAVLVRDQSLLEGGMNTLMHTRPMRRASVGLQHLQRQLLGVEGKILPLTEQEINGANLVSTWDGYRTLLEIQSRRRKEEEPEQHRFHSLQCEVAQTLAGLLGVKLHEEAAFWTERPRRDMAERLAELKVGVYHLHFGRHVCAFLRTDDSAYLWDLSYGVKRWSQRASLTHWAWKHLEVPLEGRRWHWIIVHSAVAVSEDIAFVKSQKILSLSLQRLATD